MKYGHLIEGHLSISVTEKNNIVLFAQQSVDGGKINWLYNAWKQVFTTFKYVRD